MRKIIVDKQFMCVTAGWLQVTGYPIPVASVTVLSFFLSSKE